MRKKRLMELKPLKVMNRHIADAKKTEISLSTLEKQRGEPGKYRMYCRAAVEKGILKVYLFAVTDIEENINFPRYRLFISRKERRFITYDEKLKKWRKALLESILWDVRTNLGNIYVNGCDTKIIQKYLKTMQPAIRALEEFQANIRKEQRIRHDKKLTDSWDQVMKTVSGLPKNWIGWVSKYGITEHYIFYKYQKNGATEGYCTYCKKHVPIRSPKYNQKGQCNVCGQPITFRSVGKSGRFCTKWYRVYLIQRRRKTSGFVLRIFYARTWYKKGGYTDCETTCHEEQPNDLKFVLDQMSICQIRHYLVKQSEKSGDDISHVLQVWNDYLSMAKRLGMDIHDSIIYRTRDLQLRHKEAVLKIEEMKRGIRRRELEEKYVGFQKHLIDLKEKYEFSDGEYQVIAPKSIDDILYEGDTLHHCVNKTDTYFDRIVSKESYILFLREKENPKVPFYTLEVEPDGTIRQKRAEFNRQNKDIDKVTSFLTLWQKEIQKRLTKKDRKSTEESRKLRQQNYQEIRDKHVVVHGGTFAGELLADLLEKDLMDLPVESAENEESPTEIAA